VKGSWCTWGD